MRIERNIRLTLAFDGTAYHGWQIQRNHPTIQGILRKAIHDITGENVTVFGSGRTDAGTHARALVANFLSASHIPAGKLLGAINSRLPRDIRVLSVRLASSDFHAQYSAHSKIYRYQIYRGVVVPPHLAREHYHYPYRIDLKKMARAARLFAGKHDFASWAKARKPKAGKGQRAIEPRAGTVRQVFRSELRSRGLRLSFTVEADGFLHHMVRNMVGTLLELGRGRLTLDEFRGLFEKRDRRLAGLTVPAHGLILMRVRY